MDAHPGDTWFDKLMLFLSRWARPAAKEWFTLLEWMLILSAVAFAAKRSPEPIYQYALYISFGVLWIHLMFGYQALWHDHLSSTTPLPSEYDFGVYAKRYAVWGAGALAANVMALFVLKLANGFATTLVDILNS